MSLDSQIDNIQTGIQDVRTKLSIHAKTAEVTISKDHADIASSLRQSVEAVESTYKQIEHLGQQDDLLILDAADEYCSYVDPFADENSPLAESKALIARSYDNLSEHFNRLASLADDAPEHVMSLNRELADLEAQIERLKAKLDLTSKRAQVDIESARAKLAIGRLDRTDAEKKLREASAEVAALNARKQDNQDNRQLLRATRVVAWGSTLFFPPMAGVALGLEVGAHELREKKRGLESLISTARGELNTASSTIRLLESQISTLQSTIGKIDTMSSKCRSLASDIKKIKAEAQGKSTEYHSLKCASTDFNLWAQNAKDHADMIVEFGDETSMRHMTRKLVAAVTECEREDVVTICRPLQRLLAASVEKEPQVCVVAVDDDSEGEDAVASIWRPWKSL